MSQNQRGRPPKAENELRKESLLVRLDEQEKEAFREAASVAGIPLSVWVRERLRRIATRELDEASRPVAFRRRSA
jgi:predicted HicB family RNase H-like nuclease